MTLIFVNLRHGLRKFVIFTAAASFSLNRKIDQTLPLKCPDYVEIYIRKELAWKSCGDDLNSVKCINMQRKIRHFLKEILLQHWIRPHGKLLICIENDKFKKLKTWPSSKDTQEGSHVLENAKKFAWKQIKSFPWEPLKNFITQFSVKQFSNQFLFSTYIVDNADFPVIEG